LISFFSAWFAGAMTFDVEYARWLEEQNRQINELRSAVTAHAGDGELRIIVDGIMAHYDEIFRLKSNAAKNDVFHLLSGMWKTPAERCFMWLGGFRPSELLKVRTFSFPHWGILKYFLGTQLANAPKLYCFETWHSSIMPIH